MHIGKNTGKITVKYWENISPLLPGSNKRKYIFKQICMAFCCHQDLKVYQCFCWKRFTKYMQVHRQICTGRQQKSMKNATRRVYFEY